MSIDKTEILKNICYTELVYERINKKLKTNYSKSEIEIMLFNILKETVDDGLQKIGKNFYITNAIHKIKLTINSNTYRVITVDKII